METLRDLVIAAQAGSLTAFGEIVNRFQDMAYANAYAVVGDFHLAQDAAQEAFVDAYINLSKLREPDAFVTWFRRVIFKHSHRLIRGKSLPTMSVEAAFDLSNLPALDLDPATAAEQQQIQTLVQATIRSLPESQRLVTSLFYLAGYSYQEIAEMLDLPVSTIKKRLHTARKTL